uniref:Uncharacterized protein n=1 Tax=Romanomermis culicivorax TaxID=13658 RepID=A0A915HRB4_ROMCU
MSITNCHLSYVLNRGAGVTKGHASVRHARFVKGRTRLPTTSSVRCGIAEKPFIDLGGLVSTAAGV